MGKIIHPNGSIEKIEPEKETFTLLEIGRRLKGVVEIGIVPGAWVFYSKFGWRDKLPPNEKATLYVGGPVFGDCLVIGEHQLSDRFMFPTLQEMFNDTNEPQREEHQKEEPQEDHSEDDVDEDKIKYDDLFEIVTLNDPAYAKLSDSDKETLLERLLAFFVQTENYERCQILQRYKNFKHLLESH